MFELKPTAVLFIVNDTAIYTYHIPYMEYIRVLIVLILARNRNTGSRKWRGRDREPDN